MLVSLLVVSGSTGTDESSDSGRLLAARDRAQSAFAAQQKATRELEEIKSQLSGLREQVQAAAIRERQAIADAGRVADLQVQINRLKTRVEAETSAGGRAQRRARRLEDVLAARTAALATTTTALREKASEIKSLRAAAAAVQTPDPAPADTADDALGAVDSAADCHPSYRGACVPITSDVDCDGGSGDGPEYTGYVEVIGPDEYRLDSDGDGFACES